MELEQTRRVIQRMRSSRMITTIQGWSLKKGFLCLSFKVLVYKGRTSPVLAVVASSIFIVFSISELWKHVKNMRWWPYLLPNNSWWQQVNVRWNVWKQSLPSLRPQGTWLRSGYFGPKLVQKTLGQIPWKTPGGIARLPYHFCWHDLGRDLGYNSRYGFRGHLGSTMEGT